MATTIIDNYYNILGLRNTASLEDIKRAYWAKAKVLHPDKNRKNDANEQFILLNEAYECLQNLKTGKVYNPSEKAYTAQPNGRWRYENWKTAEREKTRERARQYARMRYEEFIRTDYYKSITSLDIITSYLGFFMAIVVVLIFPVVAMLLFGMAGLGAGILINLIILPVTVRAIRDTPPLNNGTFAGSVLHIVRTKGFLMTSITLLNIFIILKFGFQTLISPLLLLIGYALAMTLVYLYCRLKSTQFKTNFYSFGLAPLVVNAMLVINFIFSFHPVQETYTFENDEQRVIKRREDDTQESTYIYLENSAYDEFPGIRTFLDYEEMRNANRITYTFKKGILGMRVMTDYQFSR